MGRVVIHERAKADLDEIADRIASDSLDAALRFYAAARRACWLLGEMPGMGMRRRSSNARLRDLRSWPIAGFRNYLIFYLPLKHGIEVIRVLHGARDVERMFAEEG